MSGNFSMSGNDVNKGSALNSDKQDLKTLFRAGAIGGLTGAVCIWIYEALIWVGVQHLMPLAGIPRNATGLVFGKAVQEALGIWAYLLGTLIHFSFAIGWGVLFALIWPYFRRRGFHRAVLRHHCVDRDARGHLDRFGQSPELLRPRRHHWWFHVALLLHGAARADREETAGIASGCVVRRIQSRAIKARGARQKNEST
jgi:hypothetical protein